MRALEWVGLAGRELHTPSQLSGGQQQRVAIARAVINEPQIILADEPTGALDSRSSMELMQIFQELGRSGITIVLVTHEPDIGRCAERVVTMRDGKIVSDVRQTPMLAHAGAALTSLTAAVASHPVVDPTAIPAGDAAREAQP
jgi:putative ABC transport system ATP-binding protein